MVLFDADHDGVGETPVNRLIVPCDTLYYQGMVGFSLFVGGCATEGGRLLIVTPDGVAHDATPDGGIPVVCQTADPISDPCPPGSVPFIDSKQIQYRPRPTDIATGHTVATVTYTDGILHLNPLPGGVGDSPGFVSLSPVDAFFAFCPEAAPCVTHACDRSREPPCSADRLEYEPAGTPCPDTDNDACTAATCDGAGTCDQRPGVLCDDGDGCTSDSCEAAGCRHDPIAHCPCGNAVIDAGEECDLGFETNGADGNCCDVDCMLKPPTFVCRKSDSTCLRDATCERSIDGSCPPSEPARSGGRCEDLDVCTAGDRCAAGQCVGDQVCDATVTLQRPPGGGMPSILVTCTATPLLNLNPSCEAVAVIGSEVLGLRRPPGARSVPRLDTASNARRRGACVPDASGRVTIAKRGRRSLRRGTARVRLPLNKCGRQLAQTLPPDQSMADVPVMLDGVSTDDPNTHNATLNRVVDIARGRGR